MGQRERHYRAPPPVTTKPRHQTRAMRLEPTPGGLHLPRHANQRHRPPTTRQANFRAQPTARPRAPHATRRRLPSPSPPAVAVAVAVAVAEKTHVQHACEHDRPPRVPALTPSSTLQHRHTNYNNSASTGGPAAGVGIASDAAPSSYWHAAVQHAAGPMTAA
jgi:hypothetical protein